MQKTPGTKLLIEGGMARQFKVLTVALASGMPRLGWKIGINNPAAQQRMGLEGSLVGWLDGRRVFANGAAYSPPPQAKPRIEAETAIIVAADVGAEATLEEAGAAISGVAAA